MSALLAFLLVAGGATVVRAAEFVTFRFDMGGCTVAGQSELPTFRLVVLDRQSEELASAVVTAGANKSWTTSCLPLAIRPGYRFLVWDGDKVMRNWVVPPLTLRIDRATDVVKVTGPPNARVDFVLDSCYLGEPRPVTCYGTAIEHEFDTDGDGRAQHDFGLDEDPVDIRGGDQARLRWGGLFSGDSITREGLVPHLVVEVRRAVVTGTARPGAAVRVELRSSTGALRGVGEATASMSDGTWTTWFRRNGRKVAVKVGDRVVSDLASDARLKVRAIIAAADIAAGDLNGTCYPKGWVALIAVGPVHDPRVRQAWGSASSTGRFSLTVPGIDHGWTVRLWCQTVRGDGVRSIFVVP